jgi:hypothetical protein
MLIWFFLSFIIPLMLLNIILLRPYLEYLQKKKCFIVYPFSWLLPESEKTTEGVTLHKETSETKDYTFYRTDRVQVKGIFSLRANPLARSPGQVKLDPDKWKLWKNLFE